MYCAKYTIGFCIASFVTSMLLCFPYATSAQITSTTLTFGEARAVGVAVRELTKNYSNLLSLDDGKAPIHIWKDGNNIKVWFKPTYYEVDMQPFVAFGCFLDDSTFTTVSTTCVKVAASDSVTSQAKKCDVVVDDRSAVEYTISADGVVLHVDDSNTTTWDGRGLSGL